MDLVVKTPWKLRHRKSQGYQRLDRLVPSVSTWEFPDRRSDELLGLLKSILQLLSHFNPYEYGYNVVYIHICILQHLYKILFIYKILVSISNLVTKCYKPTNTDQLHPASWLILQVFFWGLRWSWRGWSEGPGDLWGGTWRDLGQC